MDLKGVSAQGLIRNLLDQLTFPDPHPGPSVCDSSKSTVAASVDDILPSPLLFNVPQHILRDIGNLLDPKSLVRLALTCRDCYSFFRQPSPETGISIPLTIGRFYVNRRQDYTITFDVSPKKIGVKNEEAERFVERLKKWPFCIHIDNAVMGWGHGIQHREAAESTYAVIEAIAIIHQLAPRSMRSFYTEEPVPFDALKGVIEKYGVDDLILNIDHSIYSDEDVEYFLRSPFHELFLGCEMGSLELFDSSEIPLLEAIEGFLPHMLPSLIDKFLKTNTLVLWAFSHGIDHFFTKSDLMGALSHLANCKFSHSGELPEKRPLVFIPDDFDDEKPEGEFHILREDGKLLYLTNYNDNNNLEIKFVEISDGPPALK